MTRARRASSAARMASLDLAVATTSKSDWDVGVWLIFFLQGVGALLPWNVAIQASGYYALRFCGSAFEDSFLNWFGIAFNGAQVIGLVSSVLYLGKTSLYRQVVWPLVLCAAAQVVTLLYVCITDVDGTFLFWLTLLLVFLSGGAVAVLQGGVFGLAGKLPEVYTGALMSGIGLAGFGVSLSSMITIAAADDATCSDSDDDAGDDDGACDAYDVDWSSFAYFFIATLVLFACIVSYFALVRHPFVRARIDGFTSICADGPSLEAPLLQSVDSVSEEPGLDGGLDGFVGAGDPLSPMGTGNVLLKIGRCVFNVSCAYAVTLAVYPSVTASVVSTNACPDNASMLNNDLWAPVGFAVFNLCDLAGRLLAAVPRLQISDEAGTLVVLARFVFFPGFMLSNVDSSQLPTPLASDGFFMVQMIVFAISGGWVGSLAMMRGPGKVSHPDDQQQAGTIMALALTCGLTMGSFLSFGTLAMITGSNPFTA